MSQIDLGVLSLGLMRQVYAAHAAQRIEGACLAVAAEAGKAIFGEKPTAGALNPVTPDRSLHLAKLNASFRDEASIPADRQRAPGV